jgi:hypothetical protein
MALEFLTGQKGNGPMDDMVTVTEHWYLTEDKTRVVREGDPESRWLWASPGTQVPRADAVRLGAIAPPVVVAEPAAAPEPAKAEPVKSRKPSANKKLDAGQDK